VPPPAPSTTKPLRITLPHTLTLRGNTISFAFDAPAAGTLDVIVTVHKPGRKRTRAHEDQLSPGPNSITAARGHVVATRPGRIIVKMKLNRTARPIVKRHKTARMTVHFAPNTGQALRVHVKAKIKRKR
jgi:hypothetical protein